MLGTMAAVLAGLGFLIWRSHRLAQVRRARGEEFRPAGKLRW
jgi:hypothetical protein